MLSGQLTLVTAAAFAGAAVYVSVCEHPARLKIKKWGRLHAVRTALGVLAAALYLSASIS